MQNTLQYQAIFNLLNLCDQQPPYLKNNYITPDPDYKVLTQHSRVIKSNTATPYHHHTYNCTLKVKTQGQVSAERTPDTTQNKENLKRILEKLRNSPSPEKKRQNKERKIETFHIKTQNSQPQSRSKHFQKNPDPMHKSLKKMVRRIKQKDLIKSLVKAKIVEKLKTGHIKSGQTITHRIRQDSHKISSLRETQALKRGQMALLNDKKISKKESMSYYNMLRDEHAVNMGVLLSGKNSQINLKHLLF